MTFFPVPLLPVDLSILSASPEHAVRPRGNALLLGGVVVVREEVVLVRGRKVNGALLEAFENIACPIFDLENVKALRLHNDQQTSPQIFRARAP